MAGQLRFQMEIMIEFCVFIVNMNNEIHSVVNAPNDGL